ncbi:MAG: hypothetical protein HZA53_00795 [Planctomycetes bacterium]|nr:hypothetical protein [Planctomycetota bacterium]
MYLRALALLPLLVEPAAASVLVVDASGGGAYTTVAAAVSAAHDDDVVLVRSGTYGAFTVNDKAIDLVADVAASVRIDGRVRIRNLAATRTATLTGFELRGLTSGNALLVDGNAGSVRVQGCTILGGEGIDCGATSYGGTAVVVQNSVDVAFARSTLRGGDSGEAILLGDQAGHGIVATDSRVALHQCTVRGGAGSAFTYLCGYAYGYVLGGQGGQGLAIVGSATCLVATSQLFGGDGGDSLPPATQHTGCGGIAFASYATAGSVVRTLDTSFAAGASGAGAPACPPAPPVFTSGVPVVGFPGSGRRLSASRVTREHGSVRIDVLGVPGDRVELVFAERGGFAPSDPLRGVRLLARNAPSLVLQAGTIGASGRLSVAWTVGELGPGVESRRLLAQAACIDAGGVTTMTGAETIVLLDSAF